MARSPSDVEIEGTPAWALQELASAGWPSREAALADLAVHRALMLPSADWPAEFRGQQLRQVLTSTVDKLVDQRWRRACAVALCLDDAAACEFTVQQHAVLVRGWKDDLGLHERLNALHQSLQPMKNDAPFKIDDAAETEANDKLNRTMRTWWSEGRTRLAYIVIKEVDRRTRTSEWPTPPKPIEAPTEVTGTREASVSAEDASVDLEDMSLAEAASHVYAKAELPWQLMVPRPSRGPDWHAVLDGSPLSTTNAALGAVVDRNVLHHGRELNVAQALRWLHTQQGETVVIGGDRGDGKSSYINLLAARGITTHVFLRWDGRSPLGLASVEKFRRAVAEKSAGSNAYLKTVVAVIDLPAYTDELIQGRLLAELGPREFDADDLVVVVVGRPADVKMISRRLTSTEDLVAAPLHLDQVTQLAELLCRAYDELHANGMATAELAHRYPNLPAFRESTPAAQAHLIQVDGGPMIVGLLQAVYGKQMWTTLLNELQDLRSPDDQKAYLTVCLASAAGFGVSDELLNTIAPHANLDARSTRDPWIRDINGDHAARHPLIAQVVLEKSANMQAMFGQILSGLAADAKGEDRRNLIAGIARAALGWLAVGDYDDAANIKNTLLRSLRTALLSQPNMSEQIVTSCAGSYWLCAAWSNIFRELVPAESHAASHVPLLETAERLLNEAERAADCPNADRLAYYKAKLIRHRLRMSNQLTPEIELATISDASSYFGDSSSGIDLYVDLFWWSYRALAPQRSIRPEGDAVESIQFLYDTMFESYQYLRQFESIGVELHSGEPIKIAHGKMLVRYVHEQLPEGALFLIKNAWELSVSLGVPDPALINTYARKVMDGDLPQNRTRLREESKFLLAALGLAVDAQPNYAETVFLLSRLVSELNLERGMIQHRIARVEVNNIGQPGSAFLSHARALACHDRDQKAELLRSTAMAYEFYAGGGEYNYERVQGDWRMACAELQRIGDDSASTFLRAYHRMGREQR